MTLPEHHIPKPESIQADLDELDRIRPLLKRQLKLSKMAWAEQPGTMPLIDAIEGKAGDGTMGED